MTHSPLPRDGCRNTSRFPAGKISAFIIILVFNEDVLFVIILLEKVYGNEYGLEINKDKESSKLELRKIIRKTKVWNRKNKTGKEACIFGVVVLHEVESWTLNKVIIIRLNGVSK